jgi:hypothetical protein
MLAQALSLTLQMFDLRLIAHSKQNVDKTGINLTFNNNCIAKIPRGSHLFMVISGFLEHLFWLLYPLILFNKKTSMKRKPQRRQHAPV